MSGDGGLHVTLDTVNGGVVARAALHGARTLNLVDADMLNAATDALRGVLETPDLRCVLLTGRDERAFVGGANLHALGGLEVGDAEPFIRSIHDFCELLRSAEVPVVGILRGYCIGAGLEIAAACDFRIGDHSVRCAMPEVRVGVPSVIEAALLPGLIGWGKARELVLRGHVVEAEEALRIGLLQHLVETTELERLAETIAADLVAGAPRAIALQKALCRRWEDESTSGGIEAGVDAFVEAYRGDEPRRYVDAFFEGRKR